MGSYPCSHLTTLFGYRQDATLCSYVPKKNKAVILLSTMHKTGEVSDRDDKKPLIVLDYNSTKGAVDTLDMCVHTYTCARQTRRWPVRLFYNVLDIAAWNSYVCWIRVVRGKVRHLSVLAWFARIVCTIMQLFSHVSTHKSVFFIIEV